MTIPDFQSIMLSVLKIAGDGQEHNQNEVKDVLALQFQLSNAEENEMLPSGRQARFGNRVAWSIVYLRKAGLIQNSKRGIFHITEEGLKLLKKDPSRINIKRLLQYPGIQEWHKPSRKSEEDDTAIAEATNQQTPEGSLRGELPRIETFSSSGTS